MKTQSLKLSLITLDRSIQARAEINNEAIIEYAEAMKADAEFPPIIVFYDERTRTHHVADGYHRILAAQHNKSEAIWAEIREGTKQDALRHALGANQTHGLRRTNADKQRCVRLALEHFAKMSDRGVAELCGVDHHMVSKQRKLLGKTPNSATRTGKDGKQYRASKSAQQQSAAVASPPPVSPRNLQAIIHADAAIQHLARICPDDPQRKEALCKVAHWVTERAEEWRKGLYPEAK